MRFPARSRVSRPRSSPRAAQILEMQKRIAESIGAKDASIFDAHLLVVEDRTLIDEVLRLLANATTSNVEHIFAEVASRYAKTLGEIDDPYLRERALDIHDVTRRVIHNLIGQGGRRRSRALHTPHILIAHNLTPSDTAQLNRDLVLGFATDIGSKTSHTAIMARSLNIPAVVGLHDISAASPPAITCCSMATTASSSSIPATRRCGNTANSKSRRPRSRNG